ncbi:MAG: DEAD/DEAH box helicase [Candidatus Pacearchaeota archaeon]|jgi:Fanconi anemia group M protein
MTPEKNKFLLNITPRDYQQQIFEKSKDKNSLIVLPTGIGKTLVALMLVIDRMQKFPLEKILFLAPTRPLAEQQMNYFKKHLPELFAQIDLFTGKVDAQNRRKIWDKADIVFSTPQCIGNDIKKNLYTLENVSLLIEDEVHRCVKNYSYTYVAKKYLEQAQHPNLIGLSASPGADKLAIKTICDNLSIENVEIRTRNSEDVKEYLQDLEIQTIKIEFPKKFEEIRNLFQTMLTKRTDELKAKKLLFGAPNKITILDTQRRLMSQLSHGSKNFTLYRGVSLCAQALKIQHAIELVETQTLYSLDNYLQGLFEQANQNQSKAVKTLILEPEFNKAYTITKELLAENIEHPKLLQLKDLVKQRKVKNPKFKAIVFSQYRDSVTKICKELNSLDGVSARVFVGQTKKESNSKSNKEESGLSQKEQQAIVREFSSGEFNILCATSIGEEGLDIPEVNAVFFYEPVPSAIRKIQRAGRTGRLMPGETITLVTKNTKDEAHFWSAFHKEKRMYNALDSIKKDLAEGKAIQIEKEEKESEKKKENSILDKEEKQKTLI